MGAGHVEKVLQNVVCPHFPPTIQQPSRVIQSVDNRGNPQPGAIYEFEVPASGGGTRTVRIRDDTAGHDCGEDDPQNRGAHFNDEAGNYYHY